MISAALGEREEGRECIFMQPERNSEKTNAQQHCHGSVTQLSARAFPLFLGCVNLTMNNEGSTLLQNFMAVILSVHSLVEQMFCTFCTHGCCLATVQSGISWLVRQLQILTELPCEIKQISLLKLNNFKDPCLAPFSSGFFYTYLKKLGFQLIKERRNVLVSFSCNCKVSLCCFYDGCFCLTQKR